MRRLSIEHIEQLAIAELAGRTHGSPFARSEDDPHDLLIAAALDRAARDNDVIGAGAFEVTVPGLVGACGNELAIRPLAIRRRERRACGAKQGEDRGGGTDPRHWRLA